MKKTFLGLIFSVVLGFTTVTVGAEEITSSTGIESSQSSEMVIKEKAVIDQEVEKVDKKLVNETTTNEESSIKEVEIQAYAAKASPAQGPYISDGSYVKVTKKNYDIWQNFSWTKKDTTTNHYNKLYQARGRYEHSNGQTYYSLFDNKGKWIGYLNANATTKTTIQGPYISDGGYVKVKKPKYDSYQNFSWKRKVTGGILADELYQARGRYEHFNGSVYYSLYDNKGVWQGYINKAAVVRTTVKEGPYISDGRDVKISKKNYDIWQNFSWQKRSNTNQYYGQTLKAKGRYYHYNGNRYYSLFDNKGKWVGYLNANATDVLNLKTGGRPTTLDELKKYDNDMTTNTWVGNSGLIFSSQDELQKYLNNNHIYTGDAFPVKLKNSNKEMLTFQNGDSRSKSFFPNELTSKDFNGY